MGWESPVRARRTSPIMRSAGASDDRLVAYTATRRECPDASTGSDLVAPPERLRQAPDALQWARESGARCSYRLQARPQPRRGHAQDVLQRRGLLPLRG